MHNTMNESRERAGRREAKTEARGFETDGPVAHQCYMRTRKSGGSEVSQVLLTSPSENWPVENAAARNVTNYERQAIFDESASNDYAICRTPLGFADVVRWFLARSSSYPKNLLVMHTGCKVKVSIIPVDPGRQHSRKLNGVRPPWRI
jgi:hypothetical protein